MTAKLWSFALGVLWFSTGIGTAHGLQNLAVVINGASQAVTAGSTEWTVSGAQGEAVSYGCLSISGGSGSPAKVKTLEDSDKIWLENAVIKTAAGFSTCTGSFQAWATFSAPPDGTGVNLTYERVAKGTLMRGANPASGAWIQVEGWQDGTTISGWQKKTISCPTPPAPCPAGNAMFILNTNLPFGGVYNPREIKFGFDVFLKTSNDTLTFSSPDYIHVMNIPSAGGGAPQQDPDVEHGLGPGTSDHCRPCCCVACDKHDEGKHKESGHGMKADKKTNQ
jgi:hypothetical protein